MGSEWCSGQLPCLSQSVWHWAFSCLCACIHTHNVPRSAFRRRPEACRTIRELHEVRRSQSCQSWAPGPEPLQPTTAASTISNILPTDSSSLKPSCCDHSNSVIIYSTPCPYKQFDILSVLLKAQRRTKKTS